MIYRTESKVEAWFQNLDPTFKDNQHDCRIGTLTVDNYITLGQLTALRFIEWVSLNPGGVVALPTGKTPEFFIKWLQYYLDNWEAESEHGIIGQLGIKRPDFSSLHFFQLDEFFPINPDNERSFRYFVKKYYIDLLGFDPKKTHLINTYYLNEEEQKMLGGARNMSEVFTTGLVDLSLRTRTANNKSEMFQQRAIRMFDAFCTRYEQKIRDLGGIGFFLGGIGPDGHIAFNVRGSSPFSHTRLTTLNYESQAAAAGDLGGIQMVREKAVITMGIGTITYNSDCVAVIIAAGQSKAKVVKGSVLEEPTQKFPASFLQQLPHARFFITAASAIGLPSATKSFSQEHLLIDEALTSGKTLAQLKEEQPDKDWQAVWQLIDDKVSRGLQTCENQVILHTSPHHDDVELAYFPYLHHLVRNKSVQNYFTYCTSGYTSVTSKYLRSVYTHLLERIHPVDVALMDEDMASVFTTTYQDDLTHYLRGIARQDVSVQDYAVARRISRKWIEKLGINDIDRLQEFIMTETECLDAFEIGRREPESFHQAKSWLREFEAELVWAHFGLGCDHVSHLQLPFYSDDIFPHYPDFETDVRPILELLERVKPTIISLALDPEGSGPDTHFKTLIALSMAIDQYHEQHPEIDLHVWGYRNVWSRYHISDANMLIPTSLNSFAVIRSMFNTCYLSQRSADFPSYEYDGPFSELAQKVWVEQQDDICALMGEDYFYKSESMMMKRAYGMIYLKDMTYDEFHSYMVPVKRLLEVKDALQEK